MRIKNLVIALSLTVAGQSVLAQAQTLPEIVKAAETVLTVVKSTEATVGATKNLEGAAAALGTTVKELKIMSKEQIISKLKGNTVAMKDVAHIKAVMNEAKVANSAKVANNVLRSESKVIDMTAGIKLPGKSAEFVKHQLTIQNYSAVEKITNPALKAAYVKDLEIALELETLAQQQGMTAVKIDARLICKKLTIAEAVEVKAIVESKVLAELQAGEINSQMQLADSYARNLSEHLGISKAEGKQRVKQMADQNAGCEILPAPMGLLSAL